MIDKVLERSHLKDDELLANSLYKLLEFFNELKI
jgi:hypothetical protein